MKNKYAKRSRISEARIREVVRYFAADLTALQAATLSGLNRNTGTGSRSPGVGQNSASSCRRPPTRPGRTRTGGSPGFIDWGVLVESSEKGVYRGAPRRVVENGPLAVWVLKASLSTESGGPQPPSALLRAPRLFPFEIAPPPTVALEACTAFEIVRHGLDREVLIGLAEAASAQGGSRRRTPHARVP